MKYILVYVLLTCLGVKQCLALSVTYAFCTYYQPSTEYTQSPFMLFSQLEKHVVSDRINTFPYNPNGALNITRFIFANSAFLENDDLKTIVSLFNVVVIPVEHAYNFRYASNFILSTLMKLPEILEQRFFTNILFLRPFSIVANIPFPDVHLTFSRSFYCSASTATSTQQFTNTNGYDERNRLTRCDMSAFFFNDYVSLLHVSKVATEIYDRQQAGSEGESLPSLTEQFNDLMALSPFSVLEIKDFFPAVYPSHNATVPLNGDVFINRAPLRVATFPVDNGRYDLVPERYDGVDNYSMDEVCGATRSAVSPCTLTSPHCKLSLLLPHQSQEFITQTPALGAAVAVITHHCREICRCSNSLTSHVSYTEGDMLNRYDTIDSEFIGGTVDSLKNVVTFPKWPLGEHCNVTWFISQPEESVLPPDVANALIGKDEAASPHTDAHYFRFWAVLTGCEGLVDGVEDMSQLVFRVAINNMAAPNAAGILVGSNLWLTNSFHFLNLLSVPMAHIRLTISSKSEPHEALAVVNSILHLVIPYAAPSTVVNVSGVGGPYSTRFVIDVEPVDEGDQYVVNISYCYPLIVDGSIMKFFRTASTRPSVLVTGFPHSGSTITQKILSNHPDAYFVPFESIPQPFLAPDNPAILNVYKFPYLYTAPVMYTSLLHTMMFPDWKIVVVVKDFRDAIVSLIDKSKFDIDENEVVPDEAIAVAQSIIREFALYYYHLSVNFLIVNMHHVVYFVRYEDMFDAPEYNTLRKLFEFVGFDFDPSYVEKNQDNVVKNFQTSAVDMVINASDTKERIDTMEFDLYRLNQINDKFQKRSGRWRSHWAKPYILEFLQSDESAFLRLAMNYFGYDYNY